MIIEKKSSAARIDAQGRANFDALSYEEKCAAICDLCDHGLSDYSIAGACRISVEQVRKVLADRRTGSELLNEKFPGPDAHSNNGTSVITEENQPDTEPLNEKFDLSEAEGNRNPSNLSAASGAGSRCKAVPE